MPYKHDEKRNRFDTSGNFCSWSCMKSFALDRHGITKGSIIVFDEVCFCSASK